MNQVVKIQSKMDSVAVAEISNSTKLPVKSNFSVKQTPFTLERPLVTLNRFQ